MSDSTRKLLAWYRKSRRDLPWRRDADPYRVLVSEFMLQQTRVETVLHYYTDFIRRFPSLQALATSSLEELLEAWSGLGYYRRARNLHAAVIEIHQRGSFPKTATELARLPGIGSYTAAAVASIAFDEPVPVIDGNVERVLARLMALDSDPRRQPGRRAIEKRAADLLSPTSPGDGNQALMELGATVCSSRRPLCPSCPLRPECAAAAAGRMEDFPRPRRRSQARRFRRLALVVEREGAVLLYRAPADSEVLAGLWEFPWIERGGTLKSMATGLDERYGGRWTIGARIGRVGHQITYRSLDLEIRRASLVTATDEVAEGPTAGWFKRARAERLAAGAMVRKVLAQLG